MGTPFPDPVAGGGGALVLPSLQSPNYVPNETGWKISANGQAQFNSIDITGGNITLYNSLGFPVIQIRPDLLAILIYSST